MKVCRYELTDNEWKLVDPLIPSARTERPQKENVKRPWPFD